MARRIKDEPTVKYEVESQAIIDDSDLKKYRIELPNLYDDSNLDPYEFRLLAHYKRVGTCTESTMTTALKTKMSPAKVSLVRQSLKEKFWIEITSSEETVPGFNTHYLTITVIDKWRENFLKYSKRSPDERIRLRGKRQRLLSEPSRLPHELKKEPYKKEPVEEVGAIAPAIPANKDALRIDATERGKYLKARLENAANANGRRTKFDYYQTPEQRDAYLEVAEKLDGEFELAVTKALQKGRTSKDSMLSYLQTWVNNLNGATNGTRRTAYNAAPQRLSRPPDD